MKRLFISTGEVSGDLQGALLVEALWRQAEARGIELEIVALGGDRMAAAGAKLIGNTTTIGSMGLVESIPYIIPTLQLQRQTKKFLRENLPDAAVMIDYMTPNIVFGNYLRQQSKDLPIQYYIAPQEWVWSLGDGNTTQIIGFADEILAIFPGEASYYQSKGAAVSYVGHPMMDDMSKQVGRETARQTLGIPADQITIALLPASRAQEMKYLLPNIFAAAQRLQAEDDRIQFLVPLALEKYRAEMEAAVEKYGLRARILAGESLTGESLTGEPREDRARQQTSNQKLAIAAADLAITKSGTANLEIALRNVPQVVVYRLNAFTAWVARKVLRFSIPFMSPANLINMEAIVPELLQEEASPERIYQEAKALLGEEKRAQILAGYGRMREALGEPGACDRAANLILDRLL